MKRAAVTILAVPALALALAACGSGGVSPTSAPPESPLPTSTPTPSPVPTDPALAGDCTATDGFQPSIPVIYTVFTGDATTPVDVTYTAFNLDGTVPAVTESVTGPIWSKVGYACTDAASSSVWTLTATQTTTDAVGCTLAFGGKLVKTDSGFAESATPVSTTADCSGNPGM